MSATHAQLSSMTTNCMRLCPVAAMNIGPGPRSVNANKLMHSARRLNPIIMHTMCGMYVCKYLTD